MKMRPKPVHSAKKIDMLHALGKVVLIMSVFRLHRSTKYLNVTYCYRQNAVVCRSVYLAKYRESCKNGSTYRDAIWIDDSAGPKEPVLDEGSDTKNSPAWD